MLEAQYDSKDKIPEGLTDHYVERDGVFVLQANGVKTQADFDKFEDAITKRLTETRERLTNTRNQLDAYGDITPERAKELADGANNNNGDNNNNGKLNEHPEFLRTVEENGTLKTENDGLKKTIAERDVRDAVLDAILKTEGPKVRADAVDDMVEIAKRHLEPTESGIFTKEGLGDVKPHRTVQEWLDDQFTKRRYLFEGSESGGADGGDGGGGGNAGPNPWSAEHWNVMNQNKITREDRSKAERMAKAAGTKIGGLKPPPKK